ncbi:MAG: endonuclease/exonuclease/phosphatase family protein [Halofilum sp. (in: g-proteobacteria)]
MEVTDPVDPHADSAGRFRLLSYNIQCGIRTSTFRHYVTGGWKHLLPHGDRLRTLAAIADQIRGYDFVAVQEADSGSLRTGFLGQTEYLARRAGYPWWTERTNRNLGVIAQHAIGALSQATPTAATPLALPGRVPGRGALMLRYGQDPSALVVVALHLALGRNTRRRQLDFVADLIGDMRHAVVMGDFNAPHGAPEMRRFFERTHLVEPVERVNTWPAWKPLRNFDHILVTPALEVESLSVLETSQTDHLPVALEIRLPTECTRAVA